MKGHLPAPTNSRDAEIGDGPCYATAMRKASRRITQLYDEALLPTGMRSTQFAILVEVNRRAKSPPTLQELATALVMDRSALGHTLRPLERDGLVASESSAADRRRRHIVLTAAGKVKLREALLHWKNAQRRFHKVIGEAEAERLRATLLAVAHEERLSSLAD